MSGLVVKKVAEKLIKTDCCEGVHLGGVRGVTFVVTQNETGLRGLLFRCFLEFFAAHFVSLGVGNSIHEKSNEAKAFLSFYKCNRMGGSQFLHISKFYLFNSTQLDNEVT